MIERDPIVTAKEIASLDVRHAFDEVREHGFQRAAGQVQHVVRVDRLDSGEPHVVSDDVAHAQNVVAVPVAGPAEKCLAPTVVLARIKIEFAATP